MHVWWAKGTVLAANVAMLVIRAPHGQRSRTLPVAASAKEGLERPVLALAMLSFFVPFVWIWTPWLAAAERALDPVAFAVGAPLLVVGLWIFHRSHADLGTNWSVTLELRESHTLVTSGVYAWVRHPMYLSLLVFSLGQALVLPNWIAGLSYGAAMLLLFLVRLGPEERLVRSRFGAEWDAYAARTKRLIPGVW